VPNYLIEPFQTPPLEVFLLRELEKVSGMTRLGAEWGRAQPACGKTKKKNLKGGRRGVIRDDKDDPGTSGGRRER
jgi:hypothetical protein